MCHLRFAALQHMKMFLVPHPFALKLLIIVMHCLSIPPTEAFTGKLNTGSINHLSFENIQKLFLANITKT